MQERDRDELFSGLYGDFTKHGTRSPLAESDASSDGSVVNLHKPHKRVRRTTAQVGVAQITAPPRRHWSKVAASELRAYTAGLFSRPGEPFAVRTERFRAIQAKMPQPANVARWLGTARRQPAKLLPEDALPVTSAGAVRAHDALAKLSLRQPALRTNFAQMTSTLGRLTNDQLEAVARHLAAIAPSAYVLGLGCAQAVAALPELATAYAETALHDEAAGDDFANVACQCWTRRTLHEGLLLWHASDATTKDDGGATSGELSDPSTDE